MAPTREPLPVRGAPRMTPMASSPALSSSYKDPRDKSPTAAPAAPSAVPPRTISPARGVLLSPFMLHNHENQSFASCYCLSPYRLIRSQI